MDTISIPALHRIRLEVDTLDQAVRLQNPHGGWIAHDQGRDGWFWYFGYTQTEIIYDLPGNVEFFGQRTREA